MAYISGFILRPSSSTSTFPGIVVPVGDVDGLAAGINQILSAPPEHRDALRKSSREYAVSELSNTIGAERYIRLYRSLLQA